jgi:hypothetical protein
MVFRKNMQQRTEALESLAWKLDLDFQPKDEFGLLSYMKDFKLFRRGGRKRIYNIMRTKDEQFDQHGIFDYRYTVSTGNSSRVFRQTVFFCHSKSLFLPPFRMIPEHIFHQIGEWFGFKDIDFVAFPTFSSRYYLKSEDPDAIRKIFPQSLLQYFSQVKGWSMEGVGYYLVWYRHNKRANIQTIPDFYQTGLVIRDAFREASGNLDITRSD